MKGQKGYALIAKPAAPGFSLRAAVVRVAGRLLRWYQLGQQRHQLAALSDAALKDIGLSRADTFKESDRPFWDDPLAK